MELPLHDHFSQLVLPRPNSAGSLNNVMCHACKFLHVLPHASEHTQCLPASHWAPDLAQQHRAELDHDFLLPDTALVLTQSQGHPGSRAAELYWRFPLSCQSCWKLHLLLSVCLQLECQLQVKGPEFLPVELDFVGIYPSFSSAEIFLHSYSVI